MEEVKFCSYCGKLTSSCYAFCPWCGKGLEPKTDLAEVLDKPFDRMERIQVEERLEVLDKLQSYLDSLEEEIEAFLAKSHH